MDDLGASSSSIPTWKYEVFISFRGEDTRKTFTSHLHDALRRENVETYIDEENLARGDEISPAILRAIEESMVSVVIFSENYANSSWCLDELVHILKCRRQYGQQVVPIFYKVDPSHVRYQQGSYAIAFKQLQNLCKEKVNSWRAALTEAAKLAGWSSHEMRKESKLVEEIVKDILKKLIGMSPSYDRYEYFLKDLFGIENHIKKIESLLDSSTQCVRILGIWGMGGIGKTTLARVLFNNSAPLFERCCFLPNVREESEKGKGLRDLKVKLFSELLNQKVNDLDRNFQMSRLIRRKKVFIVLDDVSSVQQLKFLAGDHDWFGLESRIIVTTRDKRVLIHPQGIEVYKLDGLNHHEALLLFHCNAFRVGSPTTEFEELSQQVLDFAEGNPLALKIFGSYLSDRKIAEEWEIALTRLKSSTLGDSNIQKILKISYDGLSKDEKDVFLDIACLFKGKDKNFVERMLDDDSSPGTIIDDLVYKSLITIERNKIIQMHDLVQEMGREIVRQQSNKEAGERSRVWDAEDAYHVLENNTVLAEKMGLPEGVQYMGSANRGALSHCCQRWNELELRIANIEFECDRNSSSGKLVKVAKEASDMVLADDDNFSATVAAVGEGRYNYIMKAFIRYMISSNMVEFASIFLTAALRLPECLLPVQLLWVNLVIHGPRVTALGFSPPDKDIMKKPPRRSNESLITAWILFRYLVIGLYAGIATVGTFVIWYTHGSFLGIDLSADGHTLVTNSQLAKWDECSSWTNFTVSPFIADSTVFGFKSSPCDYFMAGKVKASTLFLSVLVAIETFNSLNALSEDGSLLTTLPWVNPWLLVVMSLSLGLHFLILYVPFSFQVLGTVPLSFNECLLVLAVALPVILIDEVLKFVGRCTSWSHSSTKRKALKSKSE